MYEYTTEVFSVGLEGLAAVDTDKLGDMAAKGWEPSLMTPVHNGFATLVLFRRATDGSAVPGRLVAGAPRPRRVAAPPAGEPAKKASAKKTSSKEAAGGRGSGEAGRRSATSGGRVRRSRPS